MSAGLLQSFFDAAKRLPVVRGIVAREQRKVMVRLFFHMLSSNDRSVTQEAVIYEEAEYS